MALSDAERAFIESGRKAGYSDDELVAKVKERRAAAAPAYKLTDYEGEAAKLPAQDSGYQASLDSLMSRGLTADQAAESLSHTEHLKTRGAAGRAQDEDVIAHDPTAQAVLAGVLGAGAGSLVGGAARPILSGMANAGTQTAVQGGSGKDILFSAAVGGALPAVVKGANAVLNSKGGQARALWEKHGGNVGPMDSGSGVEEIAGMEPSRANVGRASAIGARNIRRGLSEDVEQNVSAPYRTAREGVDYTPAGREMTDVTSLIQTVGELPEAIRPAIRRELKDLGAVMGEDGRVTMSHADLNTARQRLQELADYGLNTGPGTGNIKDKSFKALANAAKVLVDEGPYAPANEIYERGMNMHAVDRADLGLKKRPARLESGKATEDAKVAQILRNRNNDSEAAGAMAERADLPGFVSRHPELERQVDLPDLVRAKGALEFGLGGKTDNLIQVAHRGLTHTALDIGKHNASAAAGRLGYAPAREVSRYFGDENLNTLIAALQAQREQEARRAEALGR